MSLRVQEINKSDFGLCFYLGFLSMVFLGVGSVVYGAIQPTRLPNPGLAAYNTPAAVRSLYPQPRASFFEGDIVPAPVAALEASEHEQASPTTVRPMSLPQRKVASRAPDHRKSSKRTASHMRERQRNVMLTYASNPGYRFKWRW
jgi:hypothetical protein